MPVYEYQAIARTGKTVKGVLDADSPAGARRKLRDQSLHPTRVDESFEKKKKGGGVEAAAGGRVTQRDTSLMTRQLAVLLQAGMPLVDALTALIDQTHNPRLKKTIYDVRDRVNEGSRLADAMAQHKRVFSELYINMVGAGESSGALEAVLKRLADITERQMRLTSKIRAMLAYPVLMALVGVSIVTFLMAFIVPKIVTLFVKQGRDLPALTQALISFTEFMRDWWWLVAGVSIALFVVWRFWVARPEGRIVWDRLKLRTPLFGDLYQKVVCTRFARTMGTMLESGLTMMNALDVVKTVVQNRHIEHKLDDVKAGVRRGRDLAAPLKESGEFPPMLIHMVELGQRSGELEAMLLKVAEIYDEDVELTVNAIVSLLEPLMIVIMGFVVGLLVMAILLPIFDMSTGI
jgi:general secretion pathway protein F